jgi:altronate dehydratase small subunit
MKQKGQFNNDIFVDTGDYQAIEYFRSTTPREVAMDSPGALMITAKDNVATALQKAETGSDVLVRVGKEIRHVKALEPIPFGFKIAVDRIPAGKSVIKYGEQIGIATRDIGLGELVHIHNIEGARGRGDLEKRGKK